MAYDAPRYKIFISHASDDKPRLRPVLEALAMTHFFDIWVDRPGKGEADFGLSEPEIAAYQIQRIESGDRWKPSIDAALHTSHVVLGIVSKHLNPDRREFWWEFKRAYAQHKLLTWRLETVDFASLSDNEIDLSDNQTPPLNLQSSMEALDWLKTHYDQGLRGDDLFALIQWGVAPTQTALYDGLFSPPPADAKNFLDGLLRLIGDLKRKSQETINAARMQAQAQAGAASPQTQAATNDHPRYGLLCNRHTAEALAEQALYSPSPTPSLRVLHLFGAPDQGQLDLMTRLKHPIAPRQTPAGPTRQLEWLDLKCKPEGKNPTETLRAALQKCLRDKRLVNTQAVPGKPSASHRSIVLQFAWQCATVEMFQWWHQQGLTALSQDLERVAQQTGMSVTLLVGLRCNATPGSRLMGLVKTKSCLDHVREQTNSQDPRFGSFHELTDLEHLDVEDWFDMLLNTPIKAALTAPSSQKDQLKREVFGENASCCWDHAQRQFEGFFDKLRQIPLSARTI